MSVKQRSFDMLAAPRSVDTVRSPAIAIADESSVDNRKQRGAGNDVTIRVEQSTDMDLTVSLLERAFPQGYPHDSQYLRWLYDRSGHHAAVVVAALKESSKIGQMVLVPYEMDVDGHSRLFGLVVDFFILPEHRSGPLTIRLCRKVIEFGAAAGFDAIYGVPNTISMSVTPRLMKTRTIRKLSVRAGLAPPVRRHAINLSAPVDTLRDEEVLPLLDRFVSHPAGGRIWNGPSLLRRLRSPITRFALHVSDDAIAISCSHKIKGLDFTMLCGFLPAGGQPISSATTRALIAAACHSHRNPKFCYIGFNEALIRPPGFSIPERWHPSPVTLITRAFTPGGDAFHPRRFELIDFDLV
ncbi:GNAT family N-acetyltransferase [Bradyrhizobium prioriisuperbiae]|uniref:GNAT family N-acetyltransferase n=1 Tax=Bradyrhizobium prioriisuperbiae TaxID=2854389 RepID=UPI0028EBC1F8|nr:GNAT family N-acetyltransferase [Bradyrhizobium prioritasuperba]